MKLKTKFSFNVVNKIINQRNVIRNLKDIQQKEEQRVLYKIECVDCPEAHVQKTKRKLKLRLAELKSNINEGMKKQFSLTIHRMNTGHMK